jgi:hypothetical protein
VAAQATQYDQWSEWAKNHQYARGALIGQGAFLNSIEGTLRQTRRALAPSAAGNSGLGVVFFSMATSNVAVPANPYSIPAGQDTPQRSFAEFASGLRTGKSVDGATLYEDPVTNPVPVFADPATLPVLLWKATPQVGHLKGFVRDGLGASVDTGAVQIARDGGAAGVATGRTNVIGETDGGGFYGGVDLAPGTYRITVTPVGQAAFLDCHPVTVAPGQVATLDVVVDRTAPGGTIAADESSLWPPNEKPRSITLTGTAVDAGAGVSSISIVVTDEYGEAQPVLAPVDGQDAPSVNWTRTIELIASRREEDMDGRTYTITATITDASCYPTVTTVQTQVVVPHDQRVQ